MDNKIEIPANGAIVAFGPRIGIVVGRVNHFINGDCLIVRTPVNVIKEQMGDLVPIERGFRIATQAELNAFAEATAHEAVSDINAFVAEANGGAK